MVRLGLIGRGAWARAIGATLDDLPDVTWTPVSGVVPEVDGVIIANRSKDHVASALPFVEAGVPCFVEKPVATCLEDFLRLKAAANASDAVVFAGHLHRFNPAAEAFCAALPQIGPLHSATALCANGKPRDDTSVIWDWLPHPLSLADRLFGAPAGEVTARSLDEETRPHHVAATLSYQGRSFELEASWRAPTPSFRITATGPNGQLIFDDKTDHKVMLKLAQTTTPVPFTPEPPLTRELRAFADLIARGGENPSPLSHAEEVIRSLAAIDRSVQKGGEVVRLNALD